MRTVIESTHRGGEEGEEREGKGRGRGEGRGREEGEGEGRAAEGIDIRTRYCMYTYGNITHSIIVA